MNEFFSVRLFLRAGIAALRGALICGVLWAVGAQTAGAQTLTTLYTFAGGTDGRHPFSPLVRDAKGNLYGTTGYGGASGNGTVYEISAAGKETVLYSFAGQPDGASPSAGLIRDPKGNLYGATYYGGAYGSSGYGYGMVFELTKKGAEKPLYSFRGAVDGDGQDPPNSLVRDSLGNLYGITYAGGTLNYGTVFELTPAGVETVLYSFQLSTDGGLPSSPLLRDSKGNLYGTTASGGNLACKDNDLFQGCGTVFEVTPSGKETVLYAFNGWPNDGGIPVTGLVRDAKGNFYGTTQYGGTYDYGTVFKLTKSGYATVLHSFAGGPGDGQYPVAGLTLDKQGNLYGTTLWGGFANGPGGIVFEITPDGKETILHNFSGAADGGGPSASLIFDKQGNLYGTTGYGGDLTCETYGCGIVFKLVP